jgi:hypothetical protein
MVSKSVRDLRIAEVIRKDVTIEDGQVTTFRVRLGVSFKYETVTQHMEPPSPAV